jgi:ABC-type branched-subunit amino acid transport system substrate-binding protein
VTGQSKSLAVRAVALAALGALAVVGCGSSTKSSSATTASSSSGGGAATTAAPSTTASSGGAAPAKTGAGITAKTITVGNVSTLTGPVPGLFQGTVNGVKAYFDYVNSQGGVNGRTLVQKVGDDAFQCAQNKNEVASLASQVFAYVGSESVVDSCGVPAIPSSAPVIYSEALTPATQDLKNGFSPLPLPPGFLTGPYLYIKQKYPADVKSVGILYGSSAAFPTHAQEYAMSQAGWKVTYQRGYGQTETQFTPDILRMKAAGVKILWLVNTTAVDAGIVQQAYQQGWHPLVVLYNGYDHAFEKIAGNTASNGVINFEQQAMFLGGHLQHLDEKSEPGLHPRSLLGLRLGSGRPVCPEPQERRRQPNPGFGAGRPTRHHHL